MEKSRVGLREYRLYDYLRIMKLKKDHNFVEAVDAIEPRLSLVQRADTEKNAEAILTKVIRAYDRNFGGARQGSGASGLVYGRIQSGKTRAMITTTALALDNGFKLVVILTTNNNRLVRQTFEDFKKGLPGIQVYSKADLRKNHLEIEARHIKNMLERPEQNGIVVVSSKGAQALGNIIDFADKIGAKNHKAIIFDDEGDQATLDTRVRERSMTGKPTEPSTIHGLIHSKEVASLRQAIPQHVFVSVTGTPQGIVLQNISSSSRPSFIELLEAGNDYVGGEKFFPSVKPENAEYISLVDPDERITLLGENAGIPKGLKQALCFFTVSATAAGIRSGWKEYKFLCHPSLKQTDHAAVRRLIGEYVEKIIDAINAPTKAASEPIIQCLKTQLKELNKTIKAPDWGDILREAKRNIDTRKIQIVNAQTTNDTITFSPHYNFLIGGNVLGRGLAIKNLLVTYYVREAKVAQMDTVYQHARMFGYRRATMPFTRVFMPPQLYRRFHEIYESDEELRAFIKKHGDNAATYLVKTQFGVGLRPTRLNVLDANHIRTLLPGKQLFPDYPIFDRPKAERIKKKVETLLRRLFPEYEKDGRKGKEIRLEDAVHLLSVVKTNATNSWRDKQVPDHLRSVVKNKQSKIMLRFREAPRRAPDGENGLLASGVIGDAEYKNSKNLGIPVLWLFRINGSTRGWDGVDFFYPTVVFPEDMTPFVFNRT